MEAIKRIDSVQWGLSPSYASCGTETGETSESAEIVAVGTESEPVPKASEESGKKRPKREYVDYEALIMGNVPDDVRRRKPIATFVLMGGSVFAAILVFIMTGSLDPEPWKYIGFGANFRALTFNGQLWRLFTSSFLHLGFVHLAFNMLCLFSMGCFLEKLIGHVNLLCVYLMTACTGGLLSLAFHDNTVCIGASGAVFGVFGASSVVGVILCRKYHIAPKHMWGYMRSGLSFVGINFIYSLKPGIDMAGHVGGLLGGVTCGFLVGLSFCIGNRHVRNCFQWFFWSGNALLVAMLAYTFVMNRSSWQYGTSGKKIDEIEEFRRFHTLAEIGNVHAQYCIGAYYEEGLGVEKNESAAAYWYRKAADQGGADAQFKLGTLYYNGQGVEKDDIEAAHWYRKAAEQGVALAQYYLGECYAKGQGVEKNDIEAAHWYREAAEGGVAAAQYNIGMCYSDGRGVEKDEIEAVRWYRKAAEQGVVAAQYNLGVCYANGCGVEKDEIEAVHWFWQAAGKGFVLAQYNLGLCYLNGQGVEEDAVEGVRLQRKAAMGGYAQAQHNLGVCCANGIGVEKDEVEAVHWYRKAAEQGFAPAQYNLGICYETGNGVNQDKAEAARWYRKAAAQGVSEAEDALRRLGK